MVSSYEAQREANIAANKAILASLGLNNSILPAVTTKPVIPAAKKKKASKPRKSLPARIKSAVSAVFSGDDSSESNDNNGPRRSSRLRRSARKTLSEKDLELPSDDSDFISFSGSEDGFGGVERGYRKASGKEKGFVRGVKSGRNVLKFDGTKEKKNCKYYGAPDVPVGTWWEKRPYVARDGVHAPWVAGIYGDPKEGCYSIALSGAGQYSDDIDEGVYFTYTGEGGRANRGTKANPKNLRTGPQVKDQELTRNNQSLFTSVENKRPVRVIRGHKGDPRWAPVKGFRYDGLYQVVKGWEATGVSGYRVYKFAFKRIDGQAPIVLNSGPTSEQNSEEEEEVSTASEQEEQPLLSEKASGERRTRSKRKFADNEVEVEAKKPAKRTRRTKAQLEEKENEDPEA